jgi:hypothetical protein
MECDRLVSQAHTSCHFLACTVLDCPFKTDITYNCVSGNFSFYLETKHYEVVVVRQRHSPHGDKSRDERYARRFKIAGSAMNDKRVSESVFHLCRFLSDLSTGQVVCGALGSRVLTSFDERESVCVDNMQSTTLSSLRAVLI